MNTNLTDMTTDYSENPPTFEQVSKTTGDVLLEFGTPWCGHCRTAASVVQEGIAAYPNLRHLKIMDGKGKRLGRAFKVKLWPTLILLHDGHEIARVVRPTSPDDLKDLVSQLKP